MHGVFRSPLGRAFHFSFTVESELQKKSQLTKQIKNQGPDQLQRVKPGIRSVSSDSFLIGAKTQYIGNSDGHATPTQTHNRIHGKFPATYPSVVCCTTSSGGQGIAAQLDINTDTFRPDFELAEKCPTLTRVIICPINTQVHCYHRTSNVTTEFHAYKRNYGQISRNLRWYRADASHTQAQRVRLTHARLRGYKMPDRVIEATLLAPRSRQHYGRILSRSCEIIVT